MEALKTASFSPTSVLSDKRSETRKPFSLPSLFPPKPPKPISQESLFRSFNGGLALLTSVLSSATAPAKSLTFVTDNPLVIAGGVAAFAVPFVLSQVLNKKPKTFGVESAKNAYTKLGTDENAQLLDIRAAADLRQVGSPNIKGLGKKTVSAVYNGEDKPGFLKKLSLKFKDPENTTLFILDKFDGNSELVAELVALNGFKSAYAIKDGAEGPRGWVNSGLPWIEPKKNLSLDLSSLTDSISGVFGESSDGVSVAIGVAAAAGLSVLAFTEIETILQLLGSAALVQLAGNKLLFAEDRKQTLKQVDEFLNTKVAPKELVDELKDIGKAFLPLSTSSKALPPPAAEAATTTTVDEKEPEPAIKVATAQVNSEPAIEAATAQVITEPTKTEAKPKPYPRPLSPYASYPDLKPPTSPTPVSSKGLPAPAPVAAEAATTTIVDEPEPELEPAIKAATAQVNSEPAAKAATEQVITEAKPKSYSRPLSPYASYPDLKPPTSPTPSHP
uniref:Rhodanese domain-containing protein n=1 Tax=Brassica campestris TaxID=3711 RepID=M4C9R1_BRACM